MRDTTLASLEPETKAYNELDQPDPCGALYFSVKPSGSKSWRISYKSPTTGKWSWMGIGAYPATSAKRAREKAVDIRKLVGDGVDPVESKRAEKTANEATLANTFGKAAELWYLNKADLGRAEKTLKGMRYALDNDMLPKFGSRSLDRITHKDCAELQASIEARGAHNTSEKVRVWLRDIFGFSIANGWTSNNPSLEMGRIAAKAPDEEHYPHLAESQLPSFLRALRNSKSKTLVNTAAWLTIWTASRPGMVRLAEWSEFDLDKALWSIPADKMKTRVDHLVPLPRQAVDALEELRRITGKSRYLFPGEGAKSPTLSDASVNKCFALLGYKGRMTGHGSRHTFSTLMNEHHWNSDWIESQLAHQKTGIKGTYDKAKYLSPRRVLSQWYCDYLDALESGMTATMKADFNLRYVEAHSVVYKIEKVV